MVARFAAGRPGEWKDLHEMLAKMTWETYLWRWKDLYREKLSTFDWVKAACAMPWMPAYYRRVLSVLKSSLKTAILRRFGVQTTERRDFFQTAAKPEANPVENH